MNKSKMITGAKIKTIGYFAGIEGEVTKIVEGDSIENHGTIEILVTSFDKKKYDWLKIGEYEHFVHFNWQKSIEIIES